MRRMSVTDADLDRAVAICSHGYISDPDDLFLFQIVPEIAAEVRRLRTEFGQRWGTGIVKSVDELLDEIGKQNEEIDHLKAENEALRKEHEAAKVFQPPYSHEVLASGWVRDHRAAQAVLDGPTYTNIVEGTKEGAHD